MTVPDEAVQFRVTELAVTFELLGVPGVPGGCVPPPPPPIEAEKELTARPTPPIHGSKPACTLVRYQFVVPYCDPRANVSVMKSLTLKLRLVTGVLET